MRSLFIDMDICFVRIWTMNQLKNKVDAWGELCYIHMGCKSGQYKPSEEK